jgi:hypothetical protein
MVSATLELLRIISFFTFLCPLVHLTWLIDYFGSEVWLVLCCTVIGLFNQVFCIVLMYRFYVQYFTM